MHSGRIINVASKAPTSKLLKSLHVGITVSTTTKKTLVAASSNIKIHHKQKNNMTKLTNTKHQLTKQNH
jgi:hypothetical protein